MRSRRIGLAKSGLARVIGYWVGAAVIGFVASGIFISCAAAQGASGTNVIVRLRLAGDSDALPPLRSCLVDKLSQMPDLKVATAPTDGVRFILDIVASRSAGDNVSASVVVAQTFPMEEFRPRIKEGDDAKALLNSIRYYTLLRLHEFIPAQPEDPLCRRVVADMQDKVLSKEYTERND
jgi:hypothetical protein